MTTKEFQLLPEDVQNELVSIWIQLESRNEGDAERLKHAETCVVCQEEYKHRFEMFLLNNVTQDDLYNCMMN